jgi:predicted dehydrogenase
VKLEIAENYYRAPRERLRLKVIAEGVIGKVSRIYRIFYEGGYHGMSMLRLLAGGQPKSILGVTARSEVIPITDRMKRRHTSENWSLGYLDFDNGASATMIYSNVIHARSLGRGQGGVSQVDGSAGTLVGEEVHVVHPEDMESGARSTAYTPERVVETRDGVEALVRLDLKLRDRTISWENPFAKYGVTEGQVAVADELLSIANAVRENRAPDYGAAAGRLDQEMNIAMSESGLKSRETISFPLRGTTETENRTHARFEQEFGHRWNEVDKLLDTFFPRR